MSIIKDFRDFAVRGNVVDLAVGVVIGGAFGKIVTSLVNDIIMPPIGWLTGGIDFSSMKWVITPADPAHKVAEVAISYGSFINTLVAFIIVAFAIFLLVRVINKLYHKAAAAPAADVALLTEIRDLLKEQRDRQTP